MPSPRSTAKTFSTARYPSSSLVSLKHLPRVLPAVERVVVVTRLAAVHLDVVVAEERAAPVDEEAVPLVEDAL